MLMYAANIFFWRRYRVNYSFIFGFKQGTELGYREILMLGFCLSVLALASVLANFDMEIDPVTQDYQAVTELLPLGLVVVMKHRFDFYRLFSYIHWLNSHVYFSGSW